jgi:hypothetical protein
MKCKMKREISTTRGGWETMDTVRWIDRADGSSFASWANWRLISYADGSTHVDDGRVGYLIESLPLGLGVRCPTPGDALVIPWPVIAALLDRQKSLAEEAPR